MTNTVYHCECSDLAAIADDNYIDRHTATREEAE